MRVILAAAHRGLKLKEDLKMYLQAKGCVVEDVGAHALDPDDDYPDFAYAAARLVAADADARGIVLCGSSNGVTVVSNKVRGVRAVSVHTREGAVQARSHVDANMIALAADELDEDTARAITDVFLATPFSNEERHMRRVQKIATIEEEHFK